MVVLARRQILDATSIYQIMDLNYQANAGDDEPEGDHDLGTIAEIAEPELKVRCGEDEDCAFRVVGDRNRMASFSLGVSDVTGGHRFEFAENGARNSLQLGAGRRSGGASFRITRLKCGATSLGPTQLWRGACRAPPK